MIDGDYYLLTTKTPLSNFDRVGNSSVEHHYHAAKATNIKDRAWVLAASTAAEARKRGKKIKIRNDWDEVKDQIMLDLLRKKFNKSPRHKQYLLSTGDEYIEESNYWHDTHWGVCYCKDCKGKGENMLGRMLMSVREEIRNAL